MQSSKRLMRRTVRSFFALGTSGAAEGFDVDESAAFDFEGTASESLVCISRIFRLQAFQPDQ